MRILRASTHCRMAWKNGGGVTYEVMTNPDGAGLDAFDWRVSMAHVTAPGPFSLFQGCDRVLSVLDGGPMHLSVNGGHAVTLGIDTDPFAFPADQPASAEALEAPVLDLNVMTRRRNASASIRVYRSSPLALPRLSDSRLIVVSGGDAVIDDETLRDRDVVVMNDETARIAPAAGTRLYLITFSNRNQLQSA